MNNEGKHKSIKEITSLKRNSKFVPSSEKEIQNLGKGSVESEHFTL